MFDDFEIEVFVFDEYVVIDLWVYEGEGFVVLVVFLEEVKDFFGWYEYGCIIECFYFGDFWRWCVFGY